MMTPDDIDVWVGLDVGKSAHHAHATPSFNRHAFWQQIVKGTRKRNGQGNVGNGHSIILT